MDIPVFQDGFTEIVSSLGKTDLNLFEIDEFKIESQLVWDEDQFIQQ